MNNSINSPNKRYCDISLEHTVMASDMRYTATKLLNEFFSIPIKRVKQLHTPETNDNTHEESDPRAMLIILPSIIIQSEKI